MSKRVFILSAILFLIVSGALLVRYFYYPGKENMEIPPVDLPGITPEEPVDDPGLVSRELSKLVDGKMKGLTLSGDGSTLVYFKEGNFLAVDFDGQSRHAIGGYPFKDVKDIQWARDKKKAIVWAGDGHYIYDLDSDQATKLQSGVDIAAWGVKTDDLLYKYFDPADNSRSVHVTDLATQSDVKLKVINLRKVEFLANLSNNEVAYYPTPDALLETGLVGFKNGAERAIFSGKFGTDFLPSPDGKHILVSFVSEKGGKKMELGKINQDGGELRTFAFATTVKKCVWSKDNVTVLCAQFGMKEGSDPGIVLPNDWHSQRFDQTDTFWKINTSTGEKKRLIDFEKITDAVDGENFVLDKEEKYLFFVDRKTGSLYRLKL